MQANDVTTANREAWDEAAPLHRVQNMASLIEAFSTPGHSCLDPIETARLEALGVAGADVVQLCCNNGRELVSVKAMGAARCVGIDGAPGFVDQAREIAAAAGLDCEFLCTDIYEVPSRLDAGFDIATVTIGVLSWMPDLGRFFAVAARLLRPGGALFVYEQHPIMMMVEPGGPDAPVAWDYSYFKPDMFVEDTGLDYYGGGTYRSKPLYSFQHTMAQIIMAGVDNGLVLEHFEELPAHISNTWYNVEHQGPHLPMSFTLVMRKG
jgi:SAM-dependent methyltransferase